MPFPTFHLPYSLFRVVHESGRVRFLVEHNPTQLDWVKRKWTHNQLNVRVVGWAGWSCWVISGLKHNNKENIEKSKPKLKEHRNQNPGPREINQRTYREIKNPKDRNHIPNLEKSNSTNKSTNPKSMRLKKREIKH